MTGYLILGGVIIVLLVVSCFVAYLRGKRKGEAQAKPNVTQYDVKATEDVKRQIAEAQEELTRISLQAEARRMELLRIMEMKNDAERLKALADLANKLGRP